MMGTITFDGEEVIVGRDYLRCPSKSVVISTPLFLEFCRTREKSYVGRNTDGKPLEAWEDDIGYVNIGCLKETKTDFNRKLSEFYKILNNYATTGSSTV